MPKINVGYQPQPPIHQTALARAEATPISNTLYEVLPTTRNVRLIGVAALSTWAVTQPTPLEVIIEIDGVTLTFSQINPITATWYSCSMYSPSNVAEGLMTTTDYCIQRSFLLEGRTIRVQARIIWAITQPTLSCRVKYARW